MIGGWCPHPSEGLWIHASRAAPMPLARPRASGDAPSQDLQRRGGGQHGANHGTRLSDRSVLALRVRSSAICGEDYVVFVAVSGAWPSFSVVCVSFG